ncbi:hypothetical protein DERF_002401 [Dermatophagoides farinae]|uniref:Uncharacterized protein n=1 Tax=Dermatophagoides farinae TaxID=6954 RepID=A0A922IBK4_DERFA|nr:hypothetical protein DERF_002401 [Dermatophagoides farinae]
MFSRNIEPQSGLLNGTSLFQNDRDLKLPFKLVRGRFPVVLAFALTIN